MCSNNMKSPKTFNELLTNDPWILYGQILDMIDLNTLRNLSYTCKECRKAFYNTMKIPHTISLILGQFQPKPKIYPRYHLKMTKFVMDRIIRKLFYTTYPFMHLSIIRRTMEYFTSR